MNKDDSEDQTSTTSLVYLPPALRKTETIVLQTCDSYNELNPQMLLTPTPYLDSLGINYVNQQILKLHHPKSWSRERIIEEVEGIKKVLRAKLQKVYEKVLGSD